MSKLPYPHQYNGLCLGFLCLWKVKIHLISIKVSIEWITTAFIETKRTMGLYLCLLKKL